MPLKEFVSQGNQKFLDETGSCVLYYIKQPLTLQELKELDTKFFDNSPEGGVKDE